MDKETLQFVLEAMPRGRTVFYWFKDRYAIDLLSTAVGEDRTPIAAIKQSQLRSLLNRPIVKNVCQQAGDGKICADDLRNAWPSQTEGYRLTLGTWPELDVKPQMNWHQVTRYGWSLVLQLNFSVTHTRKLAKMVSDWQDPIRRSAHPINQNGELTLAWARIDVDLKTGEALIEEIQSDWVRDAQWRANSYWLETADEWKVYLDKEIKPRLKSWPETMLTAATWFLSEEIGIPTIFYHTHETGARLKGIADYPPPRSLYTDLPRKFCFELTHNGPLFLRDCKRRAWVRTFTDPTTKWFVLNTQESLRN